MTTTATALASVAPGCVACPQNATSLSLVLKAVVTTVSLIGGTVYYFAGLVFGNGLPVTLSIVQIAAGLAVIIGTVGLGVSINLISSYIIGG